MGSRSTRLSRTLSSSAVQRPISPPSRFLAPFAIYSDLDPPVVVLSGTRNARDVMDDIDVRFCDRLEYGRVHCGILGRAQRFWEDEALRRLCLETPPIVVGWSLGGGVGVCLTALIERDGGKVRELHTFSADHPKTIAITRAYLAKPH